jgi:hypothetical protein
VVRQERAFLDRRENDSGRKRFIPQAGQYYEPQDFLEYLGPVIQILYRDIRERKVKIKVLAPPLDTIFSGDEELELNLFKDKIFTLSKEGNKTFLKHNPVKDGVWKIIVFDIPESKRFIRNFIRARLKSLGFKKWQNSIWVSPFVLDEDLEKELEELASKIFIRLIKTTDINYTKDLEKMFE